jgi:glycosyltransferase involved in cell wall biosynthesis
VPSIAFRSNRSSIETSSSTPGASVTGMPEHSIQKLLVVSHVVHYERGGQIYAYGPYAREIDIWADLFPRLAIAAPVRSEDPPGDCIPFTCCNIELIPQRETGGTSVSAKTRQILAVPSLLFGLGRAMASADAIHVRCPGNLGLLGVILAPLFSRYLVAKYASQWTGPAETWTVSLQRVLLRSQWWRGPVTVYGDWPNQPAHVVPFFTSILDGVQLTRARAAAASTRPDGPLRVLYVGRLSRSKNVHVLVAALTKLREEGVKFRAEIVGDGQERAALGTQIEREGLAEQIRLVGPVGFEDVLAFYENADVLVLASETEGWPKAIAEGMAFGLVCIGSDRGFVPQMLGEGRGICVAPGDASALAAALRGVAAAPEAYDPMRRAATGWACRYSLEGLQDSLRELFRTHWGWEAREAKHLRHLDATSGL